MDIFEKNAEVFKDRVSFARIDVNNNPVVASRLGIMARITKDSLLYGSDCASKSKPIDYSAGYA